MMPSLPDVLVCLTVAAGVAAQLSPQPLNASISWSRRVQQEEVIARLLAQQSPAGVRKMSADDPGEKFWLSYWTVGNETSPNATRRDVDSEDDDFFANWNSSGLVTPAFPLHAVHEPRQPRWKRGWFSRGDGQLLSKRDFSCPSGSSPCGNIGRSDRCCGSGDTCQTVQDTGLGDVGCCSGENKCASDSLDKCPWGYTSCTGESGGGCCMPGYECSGQGCVYITTTTVQYQPPPSTLHTPAIVPAVRPTSNSGPVGVQPTPLATPITNNCPTGYYSCAAQYYGGCCRVDRDCNPTSCPPLPSSVASTASAEPATIYVAPTTAVAGVCATGWFGCEASEGGGCCPSGYGCGGEACTSTKGWKPTRTQVVPKATAEAGAMRLDRGCAVTAAAMAAAVAVGAGAM